MSKFPYDSTGVKPSAGFGVVPPGEYHMIITDYTEKLNKHGLPTYRIECQIDEIGKEGRVWHNINILPRDNKGAGIALHFLKSIGEKWEGQVEIEADNWVGKRFYGFVTISKNNQDRDQNEITKLFPPKDGNVVDMKTKARWDNRFANPGEVPF